MSKWIGILGCAAVFDRGTGLLYIYSKAQVMQTQNDNLGGGHVVWVVVDIQPRWVIVTSNGLSRSRVMKGHCKIV